MLRLALWARSTVRADGKMLEGLRGAGEELDDSTAAVSSYGAFA